MIVPSDKDYQDTLLIKRGKTSLIPAFKPLAEWIENQYSVKVLNIYYDMVTGVHGSQFPRLNVIFEGQEEELKFRDGFVGNFHSDKQRSVAEKFDELVDRQHGKYETERLLVIFDSFKPIAKDEANEAIPKTEIEKLKAELHNADVWEISRFGSRTTVFFYTDKQAERAKLSGFLQHLTDSYFEILKRYDEFDYYDRRTFSIDADSKENFDKKYEGSWFYYYR
jgi:hypothetical protein